MSQEVDEYERIEIEAEGVRVEKRFEPEAFAVPTITFTIDSERDEPATIRLVDEIPESFPVEKIGFHPEYESDCWSAYEDSRVAFERTLEAGEFVSTVYAIRIDDHEQARPFMVAPRLEVESGSVSMEPEGELVSEETTAVVREFIDGSRESVPGLDEPEAAGSLDERLAAVEGESADSAVEGGAAEPTIDAESPEPAVEMDEPDESVDPAPAGDADVDELDADGNEPTIGSSQGTIASLAAEFRAGEASDDDLAVIRQAVEVSEAASSSADTQLGHLQSRVSELEAYNDAFSAFIDENGTGEQLLEESRERTEEIETSLADLEARVDELAELEAKIDELAELEGEIESVEETVRDLEAPVDEVRGKLVGVRSDVAEIEAELEELDADLPERIAAVRVEVEEVQDSVEEIESWRDQLGEMFSG